MKALLYGDPATAHALLEKTTLVMERYLAAQVRAGAQAIQLFNTWAGILDPHAYRTFVVPYVRRILDALRPKGVPLVYFAVDAAHLYDAMDGCGADVIGSRMRLRSFARFSRGSLMAKARGP